MAGHPSEDWAEWDWFRRRMRREVDIALGILTPETPMAAAKKMTRTARNAAVKKHMKSGMSFTQASKAASKPAKKK